MSGPRTPQAGRQSHRLKRHRTEGGRPNGPQAAEPRKDAIVDCGWGRVLFAQTFASAEGLAEAIRAEGPDRRDIAFYVREPHVTLAAAPQELFLDPSHTFRLDLSTYRPASQRRRTFFIRRISTRLDADGINRIYSARGMVPVPPEFFWSARDARVITVYVAEDAETGTILGSVMGIDHGRAFDDPEKGASLWCLAVAPDAPHPGLGESLVRRLAEQFQGRGCAFMDLSVIHDNEQAIALYEKLGFRRVPVYAVKRKNPINERLFTGVAPEDELNPYARIIVDEARRRGIAVERDRCRCAASSASAMAGASMACRESLSRVHLGRRHVDLRRQARHPADRRGGRRAGAGAGGMPRRRQRPRLPRGARVGRGEAGARRTGARHRRRHAHAGGPARCHGRGAPASAPTLLLETCFEGQDLRLDRDRLPGGRRRPAPPAAHRRRRAKPASKV